MFPAGGLTMMYLIVPLSWGKGWSFQLALETLFVFSCNVQPAEGESQEMLMVEG